MISWLVQQACHAAAVPVDPRVVAEGVTIADLEEQFDLQKRVMATMVRARGLERDVQRMQDDAEGPAAAVLERVSKRLTTSRGTYQQPMLVAQLQYLAGMISRADQKPGKDAYDRLKELTAELEACEKEVAGVR